MLERTLTLCLLGASVAYGEGSLIIDSHVDLSFKYLPATSRWQAVIKSGVYSGQEAGIPFDKVALPLRDLSVNSGGERYVIPSEGFDFLGAPPGDDVWIAPQANSLYTWPGFSNSQDTGDLAIYSLSDPRKNGEIPQAWITIRLVSVDYIGVGENPHVSMWTPDEFNNPVVWAATSDGLDASDVFYQPANGHSHLNWGFAERGLYRLGLQASGYAGPGQTNLTQSNVEGAIFAVGTFAIWKANYFSGNDLFSTAATGEASDGDSDGAPLLLEYAFNMDPVVPDCQLLEPGVGESGLPAASISGTGQLEIEYVRRKQSTLPGIVYEAQFTSSLDAGDWQTATGETVVSIDADWERVTVVDTSTGDGQRFGRVVVTQAE
ncbi:choice-of-anchor M domain-containing protein [Cerasicoccus fimbriatus]|uniref:choice-of-anchor M domain-containing protein n=1 Tax=Cerasicoccus fimbriatus TaxID=3014554 RepID=UPI0022B3EC84|nr:choice-of-anchor M domain-containing protein [Cerasicoccus sp. TK19100]